MRQFESLKASTLYCDRCGRAQPVRERLLLVLPDRELFEYVCVTCGNSVGRREVEGAPRLAGPAVAPPRRAAGGRFR